ncbi:slipin family protein [bacterium]|nr:slipin family protein [bacterium]
MAFVPIITGSGGHGNPLSSQSASAHIHPIAIFWFVVWLIIASVVFISSIVAGESANNDTITIVGVVAFLILMGVSFLFLFCLKVADQWDRVVVLRLGKFHSVAQPGMFWLIPFVDTVAKWIDTRVMTADLLAEETLTKDTVPVDVDAVMFWLVYDPKKAALEVEDFGNAVTWAAQTALRDLIGKTELAELLVGRDILDSKLQEIIDERTEPWGVTVQSVEIREIKIPGALQDTMSRQAQAERERQARVILGESEKQIAKSFYEAAQQYADSPTALHLRAMNMLFEGLKEKGSLMIVPSSAIDSMNLGAVSGLASMGMHALKHDMQGKEPPA